MRLALSAVVLAAMASPALAHPGHHGHRHLADVVRDEPAPRALEARVGPRPITLYVNRDGGTLSGGYDDSANNVSSVVYGIADSIDVPAWKGSDKNWNKVVDCVKQGFADFQVDVVTDRPSSGDYVMIMVGGRPRMLNYPTSVAGVAPYTAEVIPNAIGFVFAAGNDYDVEQNCIDVMHEAGHAMGLDHESLCSDPMSYDWSCGAKTWQDQDSRCGETTDDERDCGDGNATQNSYQVLAANVGLRRDDAPPSETPPVEQNPPPSDDDQSDDGGYDSSSSDDDLGVSIDDPGKSVAGNQWIEIDVRTQGDAADVELGWASQDQQWVFDCNDIDADQPAKCTRDGDLWKFELHVGTGVRAMAARATDQDGNQETTDARVVYLRGD